MSEMICKNIRSCSACQLSNLSYSDQLLFKQKRCIRTLSPFCKVERITPCDSPLRYRNKAQFVFKKSGSRITYGIYKSTTHTISETDDCLLCTEHANTVARALCKLFLSFKLRPYDYYKGTGYIRSAVIREAFSTGELMVVINGNSPVFPAKRTFVSALLKACPFITTVVLCVNKSDEKLFTGNVQEVLFGNGYITDVLCEKRFLISPQSFYQINPIGTERLYQKAVELAALTGNENVLDAYCGVGTIGICASDQAKTVYSVEQNPQAVRDAEKNARLNGIENIRFTQADAKDYIKTLREQHIPIDVALIDPPRAGCSLSFLNTLSKLCPKRIVYISCNIDTQKRDIAILRNKGYKAQTCYPFDLFAQTKHVESVCLLTHSDIRS